ncbi:MAG: exonuclease-like protein [Chlorobi bacterium]|nr:exonuclease-like protein [Chlorobiota bacterium]
MIPNTFCHIPGIGARSEQKLWDDGIRTWDDYLEMGDALNPGKKGREITEHLYRSQQALEDFDIGFFAGSIPGGEEWRLFPEFRSRTAYLDIETTGLSVDMGSAITTIALYDGEEIRHYVNGENLRDFKDDINGFDLLVTYNGKCFDLPFIERYFMISLPQAHIDLRYLLRSLGYGGGLKGCERQLGIDRGELDGVDGYFAVLLWHEYRNNANPMALETLLAYNIQDTVNLERLLVMAYNMKIEDTPFGASNRIRSPREPGNPFRADPVTIEELRRRHYPGVMAW